MGFPLQAPFPWFGGKSRAANLVWEAIGANVRNYVEPFAGSLAVLLARPGGAGPVETVNDIDGFLSNFWRAVAADPEAVAHWADWPVNENDLHARHAWLAPRRAELTRRLEGDPDYYDAKIAGWWAWGLCCWIGSGWCSSSGPWHVIDGRLVRGGQGVHRKLPHLGNPGQGVHRKLPHLGDPGRGVPRQRPHLGDPGQGVHRQLPHLGNPGRGVHRQRPHAAALVEWFCALSTRLRRVRVCCGDWARVLGSSVTHKHGMTGVLLDPPYSHDIGRENCYGDLDFDVASKVREWCIENGANTLLRIVLCGYEGEHDILEREHGWRSLSWRTVGGYGGQRKHGSNTNKYRERLWLSPACRRASRQATLF